MALPGTLCVWRQARGSRRKVNIYLVFSENTVCKTGEGVGGRGGGDFLYGDMLVPHC